MKKFILLPVILIAVLALGFLLHSDLELGANGTYTVSYDGAFSVKYKNTRLNQTAVSLHDGETLRFVNSSESAMPIRFNGAVLNVLQAGDDAVYTAYGEYTVTQFDISGKARLHGTLDITEAPAVGTTLHAEYTQPDGANALDERLFGAPDFTYRWYRDGAVIEGATSAEYIVRNADRGCRLSVTVCAEAEVSGEVASPSYTAYVRINTLRLQNSPATYGESGINGTIKLPEGARYSLAAKKAVSEDGAVWAYWLLRPNRNCRFAETQLDVQGAPESYVLKGTVDRQTREAYESIFGFGNVNLGDCVLCWPLTEAGESVTLLVDRTVSRSASDRAENARYKTLSEAIDFANSGDVIRLESDIYENAAVRQGKAITLDLNGYALIGNTTRTDGTIGVYSELLDGQAVKSSLTVTDSSRKNRLHYFQVGANGVWTPTAESETAIAAEALHAAPEIDAIVAVRGGCIVGASCRCVYNYAGTVILNGGTLVGGRADMGGGVCSYYGELTVNGVCIAGNAAEMGGGVYNREGTVEFADGRIVANTAKYTGGGVYTAGTLSVLGGSICGNAADIGGGICNDGRSVSITGGEIAENTAVSRSGGVENTYGTVRMTGGSIRGNSAPLCGGFGNMGSLSVGGTADIYGNFSVSDSGRFRSNLTAMTPFSILDGEDAPKAGMNIGLTALAYDTTPYRSSTGDVSTNGTAEDVTYFTADNNRFYVCCKNNTLELAEAVEVLDGTSVLRLEQAQIADVTPQTTELTSGWWLVDGELRLDRLVTLSGDVRLIVPDGSSLTAEGLYRDGDAAGDSLTVYGLRCGTGALHLGGNVTVTAKNGVGGTAEAKIGNEMQLTVVPEAGYLCTALSVRTETGKALSLTKQDPATYCFIMSRDKIAVSAAFISLREFAEIRERELAEAAQWAEETGIAGNADDILLSDEPCTRLQLAAMLWQLSGLPEPISEECPFEDVSPDSAFCRAVLWAAENGILRGTSETVFAPDEACTRAQIVTVLWRAAGSPQPKPTKCEFEDVSESEYYHQAVLWALALGLIEDKTSTQFAPEERCTRGEAVTMLWKYRLSLQQSSAETEARETYARIFSQAQPHV